MSVIRPPVINIMVRAVEKAARGVVRDYGEVSNLQISAKGSHDFVTSADKQAEKVLIQELRKAYPHYSFITEESGHLEGADPHYCWIIDPIDGTTNLIHANPHFSLTLALQHQGAIIAGVTYDPLRQELFWAMRGEGAYIAEQRHDRRLIVSKRKDLDHAQILTEAGYRKLPNSEERLARYCVLSQYVGSIRISGSSALDLAYVAAGRADGFWMEGLNNWDMAAGILLVREAGGEVTDLQGSHKMFEQGSIIATNGIIHAGLGKILRQPPQSHH